MFKVPSSMLSNNAAPGSVIVALSPFSCLFAVVNINTEAPDTTDQDDIKRQLRLMRIDAAHEQLYQATKQNRSVAE